MSKSDTVSNPYDIAHIPLDQLDIRNIPGVPSENVLTPSRGYKPFRYPWAYEIFMAQNRVHWLPDEVPLADDVKDWHSKLTPSEINVITQTFRLFTQCYSADTEIMTPSGWKLFKDLTVNDQVAQITAAGNLEFIHPTAQTAYPYHGPMYQFKDTHSRIDLLVTPNHKMVYDTNTGRHLCRADELSLHEGLSIPRFAYKHGKGRLQPMDQLRIMYHLHGQKVVENTVCNGFYTHHFVFTRHGAVERFKDLCEQAQVNHHIVDSDEDVTICYLVLDHELSNDFSWVNIHEVGTHWLHDFFAEFKHWNGLSQQAECCYASTNAANVETFVQMLALVGFEHSIVRTDGTPMCVVTWGHKASNVDGHTLREHSTTVSYDGMVYCVTVPSGVIMVRRNGCVAICGNSDTDINESYGFNYLKRFPASEFLLVHSAIMNIESVHRAAYSHLLDTLGLPEGEYCAFYEYKEMLDKHNYIHSFKMDTLMNVARSLAMLGTFTEGLQLYASFAILLNFQRHNKLKGMGQVVAWSQRDESCFSWNTEVLTNNGWKLFPDVTDNDLVAQFDTETNAISFAKPLKRIAHRHKGEMVYFYNDARTIDMVVTPDHDMIVKDTDLDQISKVKAAATTIQSNIQFPVSGYSEQAGAGLTPYQRFLIALTSNWLILDFSNAGDTIPVTLNVFEQQLARLTLTLDECGYEYKVDTSYNEQIVVTVQVPHGVKITTSFSEWKIDLSTVSRNWANEFVNEMSYYSPKNSENGKTPRDDVQYVRTNSEDNSKFLETIATLCGYTCEVTCIEADTMWYHTTLYKDQNWVTTTDVKKTTIDYDDMVYCFTMPKGSLVVRHNDVIGIAGNCHAEYNVQLFHTFLQEFAAVLDKKQLAAEIVEVCRHVVDNEDRYTDRVFELGPIEGMTPEELKLYVRYIADKRLAQLGIPPIFNVTTNPFPWVNEIVSGVEHANFFETRSTEYSKAASQGTWDDVFAEIDS